MRVLTLLCFVFWSAMAVASPQPTARDVSYGPDPAHMLDVYLPETLARAAPVMVMVHGGAWAKGDKANAAVVGNKAEYYLARGYIFVSVNYRLIPKAYPADQARDVAQALRFVQSQLGAWRGREMVVMGHSAGAHLVALVSADPARYDLAPWQCTILLDSAALDVEAQMSNDPERFLIAAFGTDAASWPAVSPQAQVTGTAAPYLIVCSSKRKSPCDQAESFAQAVIVKGGSAQVAPVALRHRAINVSLGLGHDYTKRVDQFLQSLGLP
ncbi:esterase/lipase-like protein [Actibacterium atlanticum]|uniref:Esterase/lipase-like protein n=1 Tax=Actibacterium atlanticum TaxID=1461693 RepID=A0A058ZS53_9RHOB|nr:alpha/beta hydrolase [Actibacterium atlanticum]KCV83656.1 esterase/lipase-like protein [Actibacterium atlanticum]